jgi:uncharacterized protein YceK
MATERFAAALCAGLVAVAGLGGCATVKEKTAPCKRPAALTAFANDPRQECGAMRLVLAPDARFTGLTGD